MTFVRYKFTPIIAMQKVVYRCQRDSTPQPGFQGIFNLGHNQYAASSCIFDERSQKHGLIGRRHIFTTPTAMCFITLNDAAGVNKLITQLIDPVPGYRSEEHTSELQSPCNLV